MRQLITIILSGVLLSHSVAAITATKPDPEAISIIEEFGLRESQATVASLPNWRPQRVVVSLPPSLSKRLPSLEDKLLATAGEVELVIDRSENFILSSDVLAGTDAIIGICTPPTIGNASKRLLWVHNYSVGMDRCAGLSPEQLAGRVFTNNKRLSGPAIAEHSIAMMLSLAKGLPAYQRAQSKSQWDRSLAGCSIKPSSTRSRPGPYSSALDAAKAQ
jgi:hypothetical protein